MSAREQAATALRTGDYATAIRLFEAAVRACPGDAFSWDGLGISLCRAGRALEGLKALDHAIALEPNQAEHHYNRARALELLSRREEALTADRRAEQLRGQAPASGSPLSAGVPPPPQAPGPEFQWSAPAQTPVFGPYNAAPTAAAIPPYYQPRPQSRDDGGRTAMIVIGSVGAVVVVLFAFGAFWALVWDAAASRPPATVAVPRYYPQPPRISIPDPPRITVPDPPRYQAPEIRIPEPRLYRAPEIHIPDPPEIRMPETPRIHIPDPPEIHVPSPPQIHIDPPHQIVIPRMQPLDHDRFPRPPMPDFPTFRRPGFGAPDTAPTPPSTNQEGP